MALLKSKEITQNQAITNILYVLIISDIVLITIEILIPLPQNIAIGISLFDFIVCIILLTEWIITLYNSHPKRLFFKQKDTWISLIASIPFDALLPVVVPGLNLLRYLRLLKLVRIIVLFNRFIEGIQKFLNKTNLHKIFGGVLVTIALFTFLLYVYGSSYNLFDDFYFVIVTLTTVGYGDITPKTYNEKIITLILIFIGIFIFSTITATISSFFTERILKKEDENLLEKIDYELIKIHEENEKLNNEIEELKKLIKK